MVYPLMGYTCWLAEATCTLALTSRPVNAIDVTGCTQTLPDSTSVYSHVTLGGMQLMRGTVPTVMGIVTSTSSPSPNGFTPTCTQHIMQSTDT